VKRSITIAGHRTSVFVEDEFWQALGEIATKRDVSSAALIAEIDGKRGGANLSSAIRSYVLDWYRNQSPTVER
jgi:predicted DNA-binding ribbon-helix-helix protein